MTPEIAALAAWSEPRPLRAAIEDAPRLPGVYLIYAGTPVEELVYVGMAGERRGKGLRDRLRIYVTGKAGLSGFGEAALDRAVADPEWLRERADEAAAGRALRGKDFAALAVQRLNPIVRWAVAPSRTEARQLERDVGAVCERLWNRRI